MNKTSKIVAFMLSLILGISILPASVLADPITGESSVDTVTVNVVIPTTLDFAIDPLDLDEAAGQITAIDFSAMNKTGVPVLVDVAVAVDPADGVSLLDNVESLDQELPDGSRTIAKNVYFGMLGASAVETSGTALSITIDSNLSNDAKFTYDEGVNGTLSIFNTTSKKAGIQFLLGAATGNVDKKGVQTTLADTNKGISSFSFYAELNTYADWQANDLDVTGTYTLTALNANDVPTTTVGLNVVPAASVADGSAAHPYIARQGQTLSFTSESQGVAADINIKLTGAPAEETIVLAQFTPLYEVYSTSSYTWDKDTQTLYLKHAWGTTGQKPLLVTVGDKSYTFTVTVAAVPVVTP